MLPARALRLTPLLLLAACASVPSPRSRLAMTPVNVHPQPPATFNPHHVRDRLDAELAASTNAAAVWEQLRDSFALSDCDADPSITRWARRYTRNPRAFESRMRAVLPKIAYVHELAVKYDIPGEFVLLPWVESRYQAEPGRRAGPAGIWQIVSRTARSMGLRMDSRYDGRLDLQASSEAVMKLLDAYHRRFQDWRMASYAYNAGESATARLIDKHGTPAESSTIPDWRGHGVTQRHLSQLLAISCVVRDPARFGVSLPKLLRDRELTEVPVGSTMTVTTAAERAGMPVDALKQLNAAFLDGVIDVNAGAGLLLPVDSARRFRAADTDEIVTTTADAPSPGQASASTTTRAQPLDPP